MPEFRFELVYNPQVICLLYLDRKLLTYLVNICACLPNLMQSAPSHPIPSHPNISSSYTRLTPLNMSSSPHVCSVCHKSFSTNSHLRRHETSRSYSPTLQSSSTNTLNRQSTCRTVPFLRQGIYQKVCFISI